MALPQRNLIATALAWLGWFCASLVAQPAAEPASFRVVSLVETAALFYDAGPAKTRINAGIDAFSTLHSAPASREIVLYTEIPAPEPGRPPVKQPLARTRLPAASLGPFLVVLYPGGVSGLKFDSFAIDQSLDAHPAQTYRVFNFSKRQLAVNLADQNLLLAPRESGRVPYPNDRKAWIKVAASTAGNDWLLVRSSSHPVGPGTRTCVFLMDIPPTEDVPNPTGVVIRRIRETITTDEAGVQHVR